MMSRKTGRDPVRTRSQGSQQIGDDRREKHLFEQSIHCWWNVGRTPKEVREVALSPSPGRGPRTSQGHSGLALAPSRRRRKRWLRIPANGNPEPTLVRQPMIPPGDSIGLLVLASCSGFRFRVLVQAQRCRRLRLPANPLMECLPEALCPWHLPGRESFVPGRDQPLSRGPPVSPTVGTRSVV